MAIRKVSAFEQVALVARLARALPGYLREPIDLATGQARVNADLRRRGDNLLRVISEGILAKPDSPYRIMLRHAGISREDIAEMIRREGVEGTLERLYDAGVYVSLDEFKGRRPIVRGSLRVDVARRDFDNPLAVTHFIAQSGGSRSGGTRIRLDLQHNARSAIYEMLLFATCGALDRPYVIWQPPLPYGAGVNGLLRYAKLGRTAARWFSQSPAPPLIGRSWKNGVLNRCIILGMRWSGWPVPSLEHVPLWQAERVAVCLAAFAANGRPALVNTNASSGTRVCLAARERGLDIAGTVFRLGGEPLTPARARVVTSTGSYAATQYGMGEIGPIGLPCGCREAPDDVHLLLDKLGVIRRARRTGNDAPPVPVNVYTTLVESTPKLMLNVESDDFGELRTRSCGCLLGELGLGLHLHTIRSHEKLTSEGMSFVGSDLIRLIEEVLPARFGGGPTDYQFAEEEDANGLPIVQLVVNPRLGAIDEREALGCIIEFLNHLPGAHFPYGERWRDGRTLRLVRREPYITSASKIMALHTTHRKLEQSVA